MRFLALLAAFWAYGCTGDCTPSADIQVTVAPNPGVDVAAIATLQIALSIDNGPVKTTNFKPAHQLGADSAFLLHPGQPPANQYRLMVTVSALGANGETLAVGSDAGTVFSHGCNRLTAHLVPLPGGTTDGGSVNPDLGGGGCLGGLPDEDADGRANFCDLCPADFDPDPNRVVDTDTDGLPDVCDPDPFKVTNRLVYFDPFDSASGHWNGPFPVSGSDMILDNPGRVQNGNATDGLPSNVQVQAFVSQAKIYSGAPNVDFGLYLGTGADALAANNAGILCTIHRTSNGDFLEIRIDNGGQLSLIQQAAVSTFGANNRLRLTQRGSVFVCEAAANGQSPVTVQLQINQVPAGPQYVVLWSEGLETHFHSVVAETTLQ
jgi:hypothetical protein